MGKIIIKSDRCKGCLLCVKFCPKGSIKVDAKLNPHGIRTVKFKKNSECMGCSMCAVICPDCCIEVYK